MLGQHDPVTKNHALAGAKLQMSLRLPTGEEGGTQWICCNQTVAACMPVRGVIWIVRVVEDDE